MIPSLPYLLVGYRTLATSAAYAAPLLELCRRYELVYEAFTHTPTGGSPCAFPAPRRRSWRLCAPPETFP